MKVKGDYVAVHGLLCFHFMKKKLWNVYFCVQQKNESHVSLKKHEDE